MLRLILVALSLSKVYGSDMTTQYVALGYQTGLVLWQEVTFPSDYSATSASEVSITLVEGPNDVIGDLQDLDMEGSPMLTVRVLEDNLYAQLNTGIAPSKIDGYPGGCCVDKFRKFSINGGGTYTEWDLQTLIIETLGNETEMDPNTNAPYVYANHVFDMSELEGSTVAMLDITYLEPDLGGAQVEGVAVFNLDTGELIPTKDGQPFFSYYHNIGTTSEDSQDSIYKIKYSMNGTDGTAPEQFHQNGLTRFVTKDGTWILAATFLFNAEAVLMKCPFTYSSDEGGGQILQRFGSPANHQFGLKQTDESIEGLHNIFYTLYPDGNETVTLFVNSQTGCDVSLVLEFDLKLSEEPSDKDYDDTVFETDYLSAKLDFSTPTWGGGRPIGKGVWLAGFNNVTAVDQSLNENQRRLQPPPMDDDGAGIFDNIYDPFAFIVS